MKQFKVDVDITMSCRIEVDAESEEQAKTIVGNWIGDSPWQYVREGHYISHEFEAVNESEDDPDEEWEDLRDALAYVREQLGPDKVAVVKAQVNVCYTQRRPIETDYDDEVHDLLEEWGEDNDYGEEWWSPHCEFCDIMVKI